LISPKLIIPAITLTTTTLAASADITNLEDNRNFNSIIDIFGDQDSPSIHESTIVEYHNINQQLSHTFSNTIASQASSNIEFESTITNTRFYSNAAASASTTTLSGNRFVGVNTAFGNFVTFTLDTTTTLQVQGYLTGSGYLGGSMVSFSKLVANQDTADIVYRHLKFSGTINVQDTITLEAGEYSYQTMSFASAFSSSPYTSESSEASHEITVTVVPTPASSALLFLASSTILIRRRR
tara:strand:+ start:227486 stop:228202 length:717 start_codon:yes stop_codon:yes gene_type:complete